MKIQVLREVTLPNPVRLALYKKSPELGPRLAFFSGGSALRGLSRELTAYTHNSLHIMTAFDSGGSSAELRNAFHMPSIGDIRARLIDLADQTVQGNPEIYTLFSHRLSGHSTRQELSEELTMMARGRHRLVDAVPDPMRKIIRHHLRIFLENMPESFRLQGASIGNLILAAGYLDNRRHLDPVIFIFSKLVEVRGLVRPVVNNFLHLAADLANGERIVGQHLLTGKEALPLREKIVRLYLTDRKDGSTEVRPKIRNKLHSLIATAELICFPMGSFYSSLIATLMPEGVAAAIAGNVCPKIYIPSMGNDPETYGMNLMEQIDVLLLQLKKDFPHTPVHHFLNCVLVDRKNGEYEGGIDRRQLMEMGIQLIDCPLVSPESAPHCDPRLLAPLLLSLA